MVTKAEKTAIIIVIDWYRQMSNPVMRGPNYDPKTFDIIGHVDFQLFLSYASGCVPKEARKKALRLVPTLWAELNKNETTSH